MSANSALEAERVSVYADTAAGEIALVDEVGLSLERRQVMGIVGETGAGKTMTVKALLGLLPAGTRATGRMRVGERDPVDLATPGAARRLCGRELSIILQNPMGMFDPLQKLDRQLTEGVVLRGLLNRRQARERAHDLLIAMGFHDAEQVLKLYPHQLSGGMSQRVATAMALMPRPTLIVADEPTTALDAHLRVEVLDLLRRLAAEERSSVLLISHDLGLVSHFSDAIAVMYAGRIVELGPTASVLANPQHPYTAALLECSPALDAVPRELLPVIQGTPPPPGSWPPACVFEPRCPRAFEHCRQERPAMRSHQGRAAACHLAFPDAP